MMKFYKLFFSSLLLVLIGLSTHAQTKYYTVKRQTPVPPPDWRDSLFVVKVSDATVQQDIANELSQPFDQRDKIVIADIASGDGGFNKNGTHCFNWHMIDDTVELADFTIELCDGRPYTDAELGDFVSNVGQFCPWNMVVFEEIPNSPDCTLSIEENSGFSQKIKLYPIPAINTLHVELDSDLHEPMQVALFDNAGQMVYFERKNKPIKELDISNLPVGIYHISLVINDQKAFKDFIKK